MLNPNTFKVCETAGGGEDLLDDLVDGAQAGSGLLFVGVQNAGKGIVEQVGAARC